MNLARSSRPAVLLVSVVLLAVPAGAARPGGEERRYTRLLTGSVAAPAATSQTRATAWWGGDYTAATGEKVRVFLSDAYPVDETRAQAWADFFAGLIHGEELSRLNAYLAPLDVIRRLCGPSAAGCYSPVDNSLLAPAESVPGVSAEEVATHEYGHHVANNRLNPPWRAVDWGTKRWASYQQICARRRAGTAYPTGGHRYRLHPGEAFAESYRVLNEMRTGRVEFGWSLVDGSFRPDATALRLVREDVLHPWAPSSRRVAGRFRAGGSTVRETLVAMPWDGTLTVALTGPRRYAVALADPFSGRVLARGRRIARTVCGDRAVLVRVLRRGAAAAYSLTITRP